ncbi:PREDICTED: LOW QUALITY PROTEIN: E3 ubiquitin-protein ligase Topors-like [Propithecus coquereli]|uniref:LOW QUALITY PROTEIN: E3 ubiquitin-protein ligase Topors-like n=1 Tax=Propithecus coquereli TaxID=379532 RepID=UPI00063F4CD5|nr:PREDICTED: LOW QUALITY PROTEIN: E3 ubiquitin-protein ligase Topors-like [Propithecus coquereli]
MPSDLSSDCECPNCSEGAENESDWNSSFNKSGNGSLYSRSRKKSMPSSSMQCFPSQCCSIRPESDNKGNPAFLPSEEESHVESSRNNHPNLSPEDITRKIRSLREPTIQELLREFGDIRKFQPNSMSLGYFRDQVVMKFRRALYYSGIWVTHVQGYKVQKHFSANYFKRNPGCLHRLVPWLKRELTAVYGDYGYTVKNILATILHHMKEYDLDSESFIHLLEPYLLQHTHHFLHEFISFVHSPYDMETYDQRAIYQCPVVSPWAKEKCIASTPVLPLPKDHVLLIPPQNTKQSKDIQDQWNEEERPLSGLKQFPNGNSSLKKSEIPPVPHKTASKIHNRVKDKAESGSHTGTISTNNMLLNWATPRERSPALLSGKKKVQEKKTEGIKLLPGHGHDLGKCEAMPCTFSSPAISVQPRKYSLRERRVLSLGQKVNFQKKEEENKYSDCSPKIFQRLPRERSLISCKSRNRARSCSCISENTLSPPRDGRKLSSFRKMRMKCRQTSQSVEVGSHFSRRIQRRSRLNTHRSKSWCVGPRKRSVSRESSTLSLRGSHRSEHFIRNISCDPLKEKNVHSNESNHRRASLSTVQHVKLSSTAGKRPKCASKGEGASRVGSLCNSPTCPQLEKHRSPSKQEIKQKTTFPRARRTGAVRHRKNKCQDSDIQSTEEVSDELGDLDDLRLMSSFLNMHLPAGGKSMKNRIWVFRNVTGSRMNTKQTQYQKHREWAFREFILELSTVVLVDTALSGFRLGVMLKMSSLSISVTNFGIQFPFHMQSICGPCERSISTFLLRTHKIRDVRECKIVVGVLSELKAGSISTAGSNDCLRRS